MSALAHLTPDDRALLCGLPSRLIAAAVRADPVGPVGTLEELVQGLGSLVEGADELRDNPLVAEVFAAYKEDGQGEWRALELVEGGGPDLVAEVLADCRRANALLAPAPPSQALEFKRWLLGIADHVTAAAASGGILGIGGRRVSAEEEAFLAALADALSLDRGGRATER